MLIFWILRCVPIKTIITIVGTIFAVLIIGVIIWVEGKVIQLNIEAEQEQEQEQEHEHSSKTPYKKIKKKRLKKYYRRLAKRSKKHKGRKRK